MKNWEEGENEVKMKLKDVRSLYPLNHFRSHSRIHLDCRDVFCVLQDFNGQVSGTGTDFQDFICWLQVCL